MLDPFIVMVFAPMIQIDPLAHIDIMPGPPAFMGRVILSMLAARVLSPFCDPRSGN